VAIRLQPGSRGSFQTVKTVTVTSSRGYFDVRVVFPSSGSVRLTWSSPTGTFHSRTVKISVR
jgi:hypothetical protein